MGMDMHAKLVVGVKMDNFDAFVEELKPGCDHFIREGMKFCPECGAHRQVSGQKPRPGFDEDGLAIPKQLDFHRPHCESEIGIFGIQLACTESHRYSESLIVEVKIDDIAIQEMSCEVADFLQAAGFEFCEEDVKVYLTTDISY